MTTGNNDELLSKAVGKRDTARPCHENADLERAGREANTSGMENSE